MSELNTLDLFSGCGGFSYGFEQAGFNVVLGLDYEPNAIKTFSLNHPRAKGVCADITEVCPKDLLKQANSKIDVVIGGPPCQGFSLTGTRDPNDKRNQLYKYYVDIVKQAKPKAFIIENVIGLATLYKGKVKEDIYQTFTKLGYNVNSKILLASDYGVPQNRKRFFIVGIKKELGEFEFPEPVNCENTRVTCGDAISDLPPLSCGTKFGQEEQPYTKKPKSEYQKLMRSESSVLYNHVASKHTPEVINVISQVPEGGNHKDLPPGVGESRKFNEAWTRYHSKKPSKTIDTGHRNHFHYKWNRIPTVRENARLQSFPDNFIFTGSRTSQNRQVGNAVPPLLAKAIAEKLKGTILQ
ncbi:DNA cytosine methyltransferase [Halobacteriovorax sp. HFRX-2_2]|uniref:DNA cytosine methyltransferase n=1 Tax=unclassified Halobacteriovorax TaxID=2639665 RepID=UPI00371D4AD7